MTTDHGHDRMPAVERRSDVAVIGGSPAGLTAALELTRQRGQVIVIDDNHAGPKSRDRTSPGRPPQRRSAPMVSKS